jgi:hypothetical protein
MTRLKPVALPPAEAAARKRASYKRAVKVAAFTVLGMLLAQGVAILAYVLVKLDVDAAAVVVVTPIAAGAIGGIAKHVNWQAAGVAPPVIDPTGGPPA